jgi:hypothetical protein
MATRNIRGSNVAVSSGLAGLLCCVLAGLASACSDADAGAEAARRGADVPEWTLDGMPTLQIGIVDGDENYQLYDVAGAMQLPNGNIAVLNSGSSQIRMYDAAGKFIAAHGRKGDGPGEFRKPIRLYVLGDTLAVFDGAPMRLTLLTSDGRVLALRTVAADSARFGMDEWLFERNWIDGPQLSVGRAAVKPALSRLPPQDSLAGCRYVRVAPYGLWVREPTPGDSTADTWRIYDRTGAPAGKIAMPAAFEIFDIGADYVLGGVTDSLEVEYVRQFRIDTKGARLDRFTFLPDTAVARERDSSFSIRSTEMKSTLRNVAAQQEVFFSTPESNYTYAPSISQLSDLEIPDGLDVVIVKAGQEGWFAMAVDEKTGYMCGMASGNQAPPGWAPGIVACEGESGPALHGYPGKRPFRADRINCRPAPKLTRLSR